MNEKVEISLANGLIVSLEGDGCVDGHVVVQDGEAGKTLTICAAAIRCALDTAHETGGRRAVRAVLGTAKQLHRMDVKQKEIERRAETMERVRDVWDAADDELEV